MANPKDYIKLIISEEWQLIQIRFLMEENLIFEIGKKINKINNKAYMNGYNWAVLIEYILEKESPKFTDDLESMPEGGSYFMNYPLNEENQIKCKNIVSKIKQLIEEENQLYKIIEEESGFIEWDKY